MSFVTLDMVAMVTNYLLIIQFDSVIPGGPLFSKPCCRPRTKTHVNRVVFPDQTRNVRYVFRVTNYMKYAEKGRVFNALNNVDRVENFSERIDLQYFHGKTCIFLLERLCFH